VKECEDEEQNHLGSGSLSPGYSSATLGFFGGYRILTVKKIRGFVQKSMPVQQERANGFAMDQQENPIPPKIY
jgi:hypothetical protein